MSILYRNVIDSPAINTHPPSSILLRHKQHQHCAWTHALSHMPFGQELLNLPLKFLCLLRITPIGWSVRNCRTWHKINLIFYSSNRWQSTRYIVRKHILIFLQQRINNTKQRFVKFVSIKTYLFVQEYKYMLVCIKNILDITRLSIKTPLFFCFSLIFFHSLFSFHSFFIYFHSLFSFHSLSHHLFLNSQPHNFSSGHSLFLISFDLHTLVLGSMV